VEKQSRRTLPKIIKITAGVAFVFLLSAVGLSPEIGNGLGMPGWLFLCTWGNMLMAAFITFLGYFACKRTGDDISVFYAIFPLMLFLIFLICMNQSTIVRELAW
jgi:hypothetical protein